MFIMTPGTFEAPELLPLLEAAIAGPEFPTHLDPARDPRSFDALGVALAAAVAPTTPDAIVTWSNPAAIVLAHIVGRELNCPIATANLELGRISIDPPNSITGKILLLAPAWDSASPLSPLSVMVSRTATVAAVAALLESSSAPIPETENSVHILGRLSQGQK